MHNIYNYVQIVVILGWSSYGTHVLLTIPSTIFKLSVAHFFKTFICDNFIAFLYGCKAKKEY